MCPHYRLPPLRVPLFLGTEIAMKVANHCYMFRVLHHHADHANDPTRIAVQVFRSKLLLVFLVCFHVL